MIRRKKKAKPKKVAVCRVPTPAALALALATASSVMQAAITSTAGHVVKKTTGKSFSEHAFEAINMTDITLGYFPPSKSNKHILPLPKPLNIN